MSAQELKLKAIADAIREKDGTTAPIPAADFSARIRLWREAAYPKERIPSPCPPAMRRGEPYPAAGWPRRE